MAIRLATPTDLPAVLRVETAAFGPEEGDIIANLVQDLLADPTAQPVLSLLAMQDDQAVGHVLFSRATITPPEQSVTAAILAPLAVHPTFQGQGIGGMLINEGLQRLATAGVDLVFVLGHPGYYPRHGFKPAGALGFAAPYPMAALQADAWMVQPLRKGVISRVSGTVMCAEALNKPEYWRE